MPNLPAQTDLFPADCDGVVLVPGDNTARWESEPEYHTAKGQNHLKITWQNHMADGTALEGKVYREEVA